MTEPITATVAATIIVAGGLAAVVRYLVSVLFASDTRFPWAVLIVNVIGSALGGAVLALGSGLSGDIQLVLLTGVTGGLTTFSTFSVETMQLVAEGKAWVAALNVTANLAAGITAVGLAYTITLALL